MEISEVERRLLALHYVFPVPLNRLEKLFEIDPNLERFHTYSETQLTKILNITPKKAHHLKLNLLQKSTTSLDKLYERSNITPIPFTHPFYPKQLLSLFDPPTVLVHKRRHFTIYRQIAYRHNRLA